MNYFNNRRYVTYYFIGINLLIYFLNYLFPGLWIYLAVSPAGLLGHLFVWTPLTYMFTHVGFTHLLFNMIFLVSVGPVLEERMGTKEFTAYYLISGALAGLFSVLAYFISGANIPIIGASGALYAAMLAFAVYYPRAYFQLFFILPIRAPVALALFAGIDLISHITGRGGNIAHLTHLSGLVFGFMYFVLRLKINPIREMKGWR